MRPAQEKPAHIKLIGLVQFIEPSFKLL